MIKPCYQMIRRDYLEQCLMPDRPNADDRRGGFRGYFCRASDEVAGQIL
jgi:hypothetical protein